MSKGKKIFLVILGIMVVLVLAIVGVAAKVYFDVRETADKTYETAERTGDTLRAKSVDVADKDAFSVLLLGIDTGDLGRTEQGRSDTMLLATVSPTKSQTTIVSLERDIYTEIVGHDSTEKLNAAYAYGGVGMAMDTVEHLVGVPVDHYVSINMAGLKDLVDAVGGVEVSNSFKFTYSGTTFDIGKIQLDGEDALKYCRMRYDDPDGNYGRQERQRKVIMAIANKALSLSGATKYQSILGTLGSNMKTDLTFDQMRTIAADYRGCFGNIKGDQLQGTGFTQDNVSYQSVSEEELARVRDELNDQLGIK